ncbi:MAG: M50 family metallopeptidase [Chloroflexota bacterium]
MSVLLGLVAFVVILALLILVHELGHFTFAKLTGVRVDEFGLGFPPRLKGWKRGETMYSLNAIPLGGFVKMPGENGEASDPRNFGAKPPWQRLIILLAGPSMNIALAIIVFFFGFLIGSPRGLTTITGVNLASPAAIAGLKAGDRIVAVDGHRVRYLDQIQTITQAHLGQRLVLRVRRRSRVFTSSLVPRKFYPGTQGPIGIILDRTVRIHYGPATALYHSLDTMGAIVGSVPLLFQSIAHHDTAQVSGPIGIAHATTQVVNNEPSYGPGSVLQFVGLLSASLGVLNLLPIPALDGGRIVFVLLAWIRRRNLDPEVEGMIHAMGMIVLVMLILFVSYQDLTRWVSGQPF